MTKPPKRPVGIKIEGGGNNTFSNIGFHGPGTAFEIGGGSTGNKFNNISVSGGAQAVRYRSGSSPASQSMGGWSRAFEANFPFKKEPEQMVLDVADARTKLSRARDHIADVESQINSFLSTDFYRLRFETNQGEGRVEVIFDSLHHPQKRVNALIGDAVGNLRSTLDYIAVALAYPQARQAVLASHLPTTQRASPERCGPTDALDPAKLSSKISSSMRCRHTKVEKGILCGL